MLLGIPKAQKLSFKGSLFSQVGGFSPVPFALKGKLVVE